MPRLRRSRRRCAVPGSAFGISPYFRISYATSQAELTDVLGLALERSAAAYQYARTNPEDAAAETTDDAADEADDSAEGDA